MRNSYIHLQKKRDVSSRWWFQQVFTFTPNLGEIIQFDKHIFSDGLKPPASYDDCCSPILDIAVFLGIQMYT